LTLLVAFGLSALVPTLLRAETAAERREAYLRSLATRPQKESTATDKNARTVGKGRSIEEIRANDYKERTAPKTVKLEQAGLQLTTAAGWTETKPSGLPGTVAGVCYQDPKLDAAGNGRNGLLIVRMLPIENGKTIDDVVAGVTKELNCCGPHYATKPDAEIALAGEKARSVVFEPQEARVKDQKWYVAAAQHGPKAYVFMLFTRTGDYAITRPGADKMLKTVKWLGAAVPPTPLPAAKPRPTTVPTAPSPAPSPAPAAKPSSGDGLD
jgi:hypothetical protein